MRYIAALLALIALPAFAQNTITLTPSVTSGDGQVVTSLSWSTNPPLATGTPCTASGHPNWTGPKAGSGTQSITIDMSGSFTIGMQCGFPGDSIMTATWTPATTNTDGTAYTNRDIVRLKYSFAATLTPGPTCGTGETCVDVTDSGATRPTMRTITGITQTGTAKLGAFHRNTVGVYSDISNVAQKVFTGTVNVTQSVLITVNPKPGAPAAVALQ